MDELEKFDGMRIGVLRGAVLLATCSCGHTGEIPVANALKFFPEDTRIKSLTPRLFCKNCGNRGIEKIALKRI